MNRFFNMDNKFFTFMGRIADLIILNLLCIVCCIPIVTIGPAITAMFYVTMKMVRNEEAYIVKGFFHSFKENLRQGIIINIIVLAAFIMLSLDISLVRAMEGTMYKVLFYIFLVLLFLSMLVYLYIYPVLAKFYNTIKRTFINAFLMSIRHLPYSILMIVISLVPFAILFIPSFRVQSFLIMLFILMGGATIAYINSCFLVKIFDKYIPEEEKEDAEDGEWHMEEEAEETEQETEETPKELPHTEDASL